MSGGLLLREYRELSAQGLNPNSMANVIKADSVFVDGMRRGLEDLKAGRIQSWAQVRKELGIGRR